MQITGNGGVIVAGTATRDAESKFTQSGKAVTKFGVYIGKENGESKYANVVCWDNLAVYAAPIAKDCNVIVAGRITQREYNGKTYTDIVADWINYIMPPLPTVPDGIPPDDFVAVVDNDLPF